MRRTRLGLSVVLLSLTLSVAYGADTPHDAATAPHASHDSTDPAAGHSPRPILPESSPLAGTMLILIAALFLAAAIVGPVARYHAPDEPPEPSSHDDHGHGAHGHDAHGHDAHGHGH